MSTITAKFIEDNYPKVKELMLQRQEEQGNKRDWSVFEGYLQACTKGIDWTETPEGLTPWDEALNLGNFAPLYDLHPEWSEPKQEEPAQLVDGVLKALYKDLKGFEAMGFLTTDAKIGLGIAIEQVGRYMRGELQPATDSETNLNE